MLKEHLEFFTVDLSGGWSPPPGYPPGIEEKRLAGALDESRRYGCRTRLLRFAPGAFTTLPFEHTYWEEVFLVQGDLSVGGERFEPFTYAVRPPGTPHGPFQSESGCLLFEIHYFEPGEKRS
ncbi:MAG: cupin domain-containing protein [Planctomycetes bacterium]|nr:cupin domain-containing protein [Planctomycetota bacterium]